MNQISRNTKFFILSVSTLSLLLFQNCGKSFKPFGQAESSSVAGSSLNAFKCDANADPSPVSTRRLSKVEYERTLYSLLSGLTSSDQTSIRNALAPLVASIPDDTGLKFDTADVLLSAAHVPTYLAIAKAFAAEIFKSQARLQAFVGTCATLTSVSDACVDSFLNSRGTQILRRPIAALEASKFKTQMKGYSGTPAQWLIVGLLMQPNFLFHVETQGVEIRPGVLKVSPYELASRISFYLLKQGPDQALLNKAADGSIFDPQIIASEIDRLVSSCPTLVNDSVDRFYEGWISYQNVAYPLAPKTPAEIAFAQGQSLNRDSLINELKNMTRYYTNMAGGSFEDMFSSPFSFATDTDLAKIYNVAVWNSNPTQMIRFPKGERAGLLGRAAFHTSNKADTSPILRGLYIRRKIFCEELTPPPSAIANMIRDPAPDPLLSTRVRFEQKTASTACMGCHQAINPLGFALESFDAFGRFRTLERTYDDSGKLVSQIPIDSVVQPRIDLNDSRTSSSLEEFSQLVNESGKARSCMAMSFFQFAYNRVPDRTKDGCALSSIDSVAQKAGGLKSMIFYAPTEASFQLRKVD